MDWCQHHHQGQGFFEHLLFLTLSPTISWPLNLKQQIYKYVKTLIFNFPSMFVQECRVYTDTCTCITFLCNTDVSCVRWKGYIIKVTCHHEFFKYESMYFLCLLAAIRCEHLFCNLGERFFGFCSCRFKALSKECRFFNFFINL